jgi:site-specific DNA recombinase
VKTWLTYTRVSTADQAEHGTSLEAQRMACRAYAQALNLTVGEEITDAGLSAATLDRPGVQRVLSEIKAGSAAGVIVWRLDRLTRSLRDLLDMLALFGDKAGLVSVTEHLDTTTPMGRFVVHLLGSIAQLERETTAGRVRTNMRHLRSQGYWTGGKLAAGLALAEDGARKRIIAGPDADHVRQVWPLVLGGASLGECCQRLESLGVPTPGGGEHWTPTQVSNLIRSPQVAGILVDHATQAATIAELASRDPRRHKGARLGSSPTPTILQGLMRCPTCSAPMVQVQAHGRSRIYQYLRCTGRAKRLCRAKDLPMDLTEQAVLESVADLVVRPALWEMILAGQARAMAATSDLTAERERAQTERQRLNGRLEALAMSPESADLAPALAALGRQVRAIDLRIAEIDGTLAAAATDQQTLSLVRERLTGEAQQLLTLPRERQQFFLREVVAQVTIQDGEVIVDLYRPGFVHNALLVLPGAPETIRMTRPLARRLSRRPSPRSGPTPKCQKIRKLG